MVQSRRYKPKFMSYEELVTFKWPYAEFTPEARQLFPRSQHYADHWCHNYRATHHMLLALAEPRGDVSGAVLHGLGLTPKILVGEVRELDPHGGSVVRLGSISSTLGMIEATRHAMCEAVRLRGPTGLITEDHIFLGIIEHGEEVVQEIFRRHGIAPRQLRREVLHCLGDHSAV